METLTRSNVPRFLTGFVAVALSIYFIFVGRSEISIVVASSFFLLISVTDTLYSKIFNASTLALLVAGFALNIYSFGISGFFFSLWGFLLGLALLLLPYLMGGMGAGDVKALATLGALLGAAQIFQVFLYTALIGGILGLLHFLFAPDLGQRCREIQQNLSTLFLTQRLSPVAGEGKRPATRFPYAAAIALGFFSYLNWGKLI